MIKQISLIKPEDNEPIKLNYYDNQSDRLLIFVGGSGDDRNKFADLIRELEKTGFTADFLTFSFRGLENDQPRALAEQPGELEEVMFWVLSHFKGIEVDLWATSAGAFSACHILSHPLFASLLHKVMLFDPADYYLHTQTKQQSEFAWSGAQKYDPRKATAAGLLKHLPGTVKVGVMHLTLRNYSEKGYAPEKERGRDNPKFFPRLNTRMVKTFFDNLPAANRAKYQEVKDLPHAIMRDGDIRKNVVKTAKLIKDFFAV